ncbi:hypothetical protein JOY44_21040 [Phormidium sp. CLA17]|uniref:hypothetical protein n=1 Tax=Leptolyngbya sp. Cla-17 TaxID=2803751 RepID=UPI001490F2C4|nr:hypothetical protein [Leptolyngbya sp. Cla-17]MBM0744075.1 hypothetical protein [Leptolyngbya sp. Cla-17]
MAYALSITVEYVDAVCKGVAVDTIAALKFCPHCWVPGTPPDPMWTHPRSKHCFACGSQLRDRCASCRNQSCRSSFGSALTAVKLKKVMLLRSLPDNL